MRSTVSARVCTTVLVTICECAHVCVWARVCLWIDHHYGFFSLTAIDGSGLLCQSRDQKGWHGTRSSKAVFGSGRSMLPNQSFFSVNFVSEVPHHGSVILWKPYDCICGQYIGNFSWIMFCKERVEILRKLLHSFYSDYNSKGNTFYTLYCITFDSTRILLWASLLVSLVQCSSSTNCIR